MSTSVEGTHEALLKKARAALSAKELDAARAFLSAARAQKGNKFSAIITLIEAEVAYASGDVESAEAQLEGLLDREPNHFWAAFRLTSWARKRGALDMAKARLLAVRACDPKNEKRPLWMLRVEIAQDLGDLTEARCILLQMAERFSNDPWPWNRLALQEQRASDVDAALECFDEALKRSPDNKQFALQRARCAYAAQRFGLAEEAYLGIIDRFGPEPDTVVVLAALYRRKRDTACETDALLSGLRSFPHSYVLWDYVFNFYSEQASENVLNETVRLLRAHTKTPKVDYLELKSLISVHNYEAAYTLCRRLGSFVEAPEQALDRAKILFGLQRYRLALRYLRLCLRRWQSSVMQHFDLPKLQHDLFGFVSLSCHLWSS